jgi:hypothetical protein
MLEYGSTRDRSSWGILTRIFDSRVVKMKSPSGELGLWRFNARCECLRLLFRLEPGVGIQNQVLDLVELGREGHGTS